ncbi:MAG: class I SAM-dependent methyltransferase [Algiphilus sp.]|uniref:class I SAM-dependent methyltransferase n=1 Tax=Algiphilus sp. TaxID=1872431 RepID=UPI0032EB911F
MTGDTADIARAANKVAYELQSAGQKKELSPHLKHESIRTLYAGLVRDVFEAASSGSGAPRLLDLGAGDGLVTLPFLELGAQVTAVDLSERQLAVLASRCDAHAERLTCVESDIFAFLGEDAGVYDVVVMNSFIHHIPDYLGLMKLIDARIAPGGQFFSFQDPMRYDTIGTPVRLYSEATYAAWRFTQPDSLGGLARKLRRWRGEYRDDSVHDNAEFHVVREGVDQNALRDFFEAMGYGVRVVSYFSTQATLFQTLGDRLGFRNQFALIAQRH